MTLTSQPNSSLRYGRGRCISNQKLLQFARTLIPTTVVLTLATAAHAQGTMDFSGAQTLMGTFNTLTAHVRTDAVSHG